MAKPCYCAVFRHKIRTTEHEILQLNAARNAVKFTRLTYCLFSLLLCNVCRSLSIAYAPFLQRSLLVSQQPASIGSSLVPKLTADATQKSF